MKVLIAHNAYPNYGGEDTVVSNEINMLKRNSVDVVPHIIPTKESGLTNLIRCGLSSVWNPFSARKLKAQIRKHKPDIVHFHNTFPLLSPSVFSACRAEGIPAVQTIHNYRHICPSGGFFRDGHVCEECLGKKFPTPSLKHSCYRSSTIATAVPAITAYVQRIHKTFSKDLDALIALNQFGKDKLIEGGIPEEKIRIKPNFTPEIKLRKTTSGKQDSLSFCFTGRLSKDKGVEVLLNAWNQLISELNTNKIPNSEHPSLKIAGEGELQTQVQEAALKHASINYVGHLTHAEAIELVQNSDGMICPSIWYEGMPMTILEAFSQGKPVIASSIGALPEMVDHQTNGWIFPPGDSNALKNCLREIVLSPDEMNIYGAAAKDKWIRCYSEQKNFQLLMQIYQSIIDSV